MTPAIFPNLRFKYLLKNLKLVLEALILKIHLHLSFIHQVKDSLFGLLLWNFDYYLRILFLSNHNIVI